MYKVLKVLKDSGNDGEFLVPSVKKVIKGRISDLSKDVVMIDSKNESGPCQYITHPNNVCIVQRRD